MNFYAVVIDGYILTALLLVYFLIRDAYRGNKYFFGRHLFFTYILAIILGIGIITATDAHLIETNIIKIKTENLEQKNITTPIKIAFLADIQVGNHKKSAWVEKIVKKVEIENPDLVILGGDQIDNEGTFDDETIYLEPLRALVQKYPTYAVIGNHEYGIGEETRTDPTKHTGDHSKWEIKKFNELGIKLLRNQNDCLFIKQQKICLFGLDDIWGGKPNFENLNTTSTPLIFITHNPDGILDWPKNFRTPDLVLAGHTHGGQVWLPFWGPMASAGIELPKKYYRGLNYYSIKNNDNLDSRLRGNDNNTTVPIYTSVGLGESGGAIRFFATPEITIINLK